MLLAVVRFAGWELDGSVSALIDMLCSWPITLWLACVIAAVPWTRAYPIARFSKSLIAPLLVSAVGLSLVLTEIAGWIPIPELIEDIFHELMSGNPVAKFIAIVVLAPVAEEMLFRGLIFREFARRYSTRHAIWGSAALFALFHLNPWQAIVAFPIGVLAAWLVLRTGSIIPGIVLHAVLNFTSVFLLVPIGVLFGYNEDQMYEAAHLPWQMLVGGGLATVIGLIWLWQVGRGGRAAESAIPPKVPFDAPSTLQ